MKRVLTKYINSIKTGYSYDDEYNKILNFTFYGDGEGDFEEIADEAELEIVRGYIEYCEEQIKLAKVYIGSKRKPIVED